MKLITCPEEFKPKNKDEIKKTIFLAGSISGAQKWQDKMVDLLKDTDVILLNPRRTEDFDMSNLDLSKKQIDW